MMNLPQHLLTECVSQDLASSEQKPFFFIWEYVSTREASGKKEQNEDEEKDKNEEKWKQCMALTILWCDEISAIEFMVCCCYCCWCISSSFFLRLGQCLQYKVDISIENTGMAYLYISFAEFRMATIFQSIRYWLDQHYYTQTDSLIFISGIQITIRFSGTASEKNWPLPCMIISIKWSFIVCASACLRVRWGQYIRIFECAVFQFGMVAFTRTFTFAVNEKRQNQISNRSQYSITTH